MTTLIRRTARAVLLGVLKRWFLLLTPAGAEGEIVVYHGWRDFERKSIALAEQLRNKGWTVKVQSGHSFLTRARIKFSPRLHIGFWNTFYVAYLPRKYVFYNAEPLSLPKWNANPDWTLAMRGAQQVWDYASGDRTFVDSAVGVPFRFVPFGYAPSYERSYARSLGDAQLTEDVDVLFVGMLSERRKRIIASISAAGIQVRTVTYENPLRGPELDRLIARSKIVLNVFAVDEVSTHIVDFARLDHLLSNGRFVLHEQTDEHARDVDFERYVAMGSADALPALCLHYLANDELRQSMAARAREWFCAERKWDAVIPYEDVHRLLAEGRRSEGAS